MSSTDTTDDLSELLDRLEAAAAAATPGPWERWHDQEGLPGWDGFIVIGDGSPEGAECNPTARVYTEDDAALIVAAVNALPTLIAELRAHQAAVQAVQRAIETAPVMFFDNGYPVKAVPVAQLLDLPRAAVAALDPKEQD